MGEAVDPRVLEERGELATFKSVDGRLRDAWECWQRMPDRERSWQHVKALWPDIKRGRWRENVEGEFDEQEAVKEPPARPRPTRDQIAAMVEASEWLGLLSEEDRKLVALVLAAKVRRGRRFSWIKLWQRLGREGGPSPDALRMRYSRAITTIAQGLSR